MPFLATIHTPGYLPQDDDPPVFDTAHEAWAYLASEREREEDAAGETDHLPDCDWNSAFDYSEVVTRLRDLGDEGNYAAGVYQPTGETEDDDLGGYINGPGYVGASTPGMCQCPDIPEQSPTDLGRVYTVTEVEAERDETPA